MDLGRIRAGYIDMHVSFFENHTVAKHSHSIVFVEICIRSFRVLRSTVFWNVCCAIRLGQKKILLPIRLLISIESCGECIIASQFFLRGASIFNFFPLSHFDQPFFYVEIVVHLVSRLATFHNEGIVNVL